jgi:hypothetical protein
MVSYPLQIHLFCVAGRGRESGGSGNLHFFAYLCATAQQLFTAGA